MRKALLFGTRTYEVTDQAILLVQSQRLRLTVSCSRGQPMRDVSRRNMSHALFLSRADSSHAGLPSDIGSREYPDEDDSFKLLYHTGEPDNVCLKGASCTVQRA